MQKVTYVTAAQSHQFRYRRLRYRAEWRGLIMRRTSNDDGQQKQQVHDEISLSHKTRQKQG